MVPPGANSLERMTSPASLQCRRRASLDIAVQKHKMVTRRGTRSSVEQLQHSCPTSYDGHNQSMLIWKSHPASAIRMPLLFLGEAIRSSTFPHPFSWLCMFTHSHLLCITAHLFRSLPATGDRGSCCRSASQMLLDKQRA
jgi:hypothetical protein